jgi:hypothetical protein
MDDLIDAYERLQEERRERLRPVRPDLFDEDEDDNRQADRDWPDPSTEA